MRPLLASHLLARSLTLPVWLYLSLNICNLTLQAVLLWGLGATGWGLKTWAGRGVGRFYKKRSQTPPQSAAFTGGLCNILVPITK